MSSDEPKKKSDTEKAEIVFQEEFVRLRELGDKPSIEDLCSQHPELADALRILHSFYWLHRTDAPLGVATSAISGRWPQASASEAARDPGSVRYCIRCGRELVATRLCPDCGAANFFRHIPAPERRRSSKKPPRRRAPLAAARATRPAAAGSVGANPPDDRVTMVRRPVALLRRVAPPHDEHVLYPGITDVGARRPAGVLIDEPAISSRHARIACRLGEAGQPEMAIIDRGSTNGTFVNGKRVKKRKLASGDRVRFADIEFELKMLAGEEPR
ncbi:MAG: FHA domain-containing protein, partial [Planctomycetes bacterium]|nr:FHA domain-containing protein [Planctomycetota bacterium]